jgi:hypothetical protein
MALDVILQVIIHFLGIPVLGSPDASSPVSLKRSSSLSEPLLIPRRL